MKIYHTLDALFFEKSVISIGNFDGVHLGHRLIIKTLKDLSYREKAPSVLISFQPHTRFFLQKGLQEHLLSTQDQKIDLLKSLSVDHLILLEFKQTLAKKTAAEFLKDLQKKLCFSHLVLGKTAKLGSDRQSDGLRKIAAEENFTLEQIEPLKENQEKVSSSSIRDLLKLAHLEKVEKLLKRPYSITGTVTKGRKQARFLGFPTANVSLEQLCLPPFGVYSVFAKVKGSMFKGIANLGVAPTFGRHTALLEVHLFNFDEEIYEEKMEVFFKSFLRPEQKFASKEALKEQIQRDILAAHQL